MARYTGPSWKQSRRLKYSVLENGKELYNGKVLLMSFANGEFYGGGYHCAPFAKIDDGLIELQVEEITDTDIDKLAELVSHFDEAEELGIEFEEYNYRWKIC